MDWVNSLGFDAITVDLPFFRLKNFRHRIPLSQNWKFGIRHICADKIESVLGSLPENKFLFSFSEASVAALMAIARRHAIDIKAWICEGGPSEDLTLSMNRLHAWIWGIWHYQYDSDCDLHSLPMGFPVVSVRSEQDPIIPSENIDNFFANSFNHIDLQRVTLHRDGHISALNGESELYKQIIGGVLTSRGSPI